MLKLNKYAEEMADRLVKRLKTDYNSATLIELTGFVDYWHSKRYDVRKYERVLTEYNDFDE